VKTAHASSVVGSSSTEPLLISDGILDLSENDRLISSPTGLRRNPRFQRVAREVVLDPSKAPIGLTNLLTVAIDGVLDPSAVHSPVKGVIGGVSYSPEIKTGPVPVLARS